MSVRLADGGCDFDALFFLAQRNLFFPARRRVSFCRRRNVAALPFPSGQSAL